MTTKPTPGPWYFSNGKIYGQHGETEFCRIITDMAPSPKRHEEYTANARLIAEAGTVFHETGLTPRQLAEQRERLLEALEDYASYPCPICGGDCSAANPPVYRCPPQLARAAIAAAKGETP